ncbi:hypothetical protein [Streptomyces sp. AC550_RSS872]|uniref:hypothetical protein n=1 Tax=Streptomyces sp. AC550_RSS872 TaxID=2823689 RepID=UPI0020B8956D|nr:hypothetical protein [Streptomyces sp. AC550_RSS872]
MTVRERPVESGGRRQPSRLSATADEDAAQAHDLEGPVSGDGFDEDRAGPLDRGLHLADLSVGEVIRFRIKGTDETCEVKVKRVTEYPDFETLLDGEGRADVNPTATREQQVANIRAIYPPEKEALGALAVENRRAAA